MVTVLISTDGTGPIIALSGESSPINMDRTVPKTGGEAIELYMRTYYSLLRSTDTIQIETLEESHMAMDSSLHIHARASKPDISALTYATLRLPSVMRAVNIVLIGQLEESFIRAGWKNIQEWERVYAPGRRRRVHYDGKHMLAVFIASRSDIDDIVPILTAYQIEWNKLHNLLQTETARTFIDKLTTETLPLSTEHQEQLAEMLDIETEDVSRLEVIWKDNFIETLRQITEQRKLIGMRLLAASVAAYRRATAYWWQELHDTALEKGVDPQERPVYFVSSNTHAIPNLLTGFARREEERLIRFVREAQYHDLLEEYYAIQDHNHPVSLANFLYYIQKKYLSDQDHTERLRLLTDEESIGIYRMPNRHGFQIAAQIIELNKILTDWIDPRICEPDDLPILHNSNALIINIDYPLGMAAYEILNRITERVGSLIGVYVMGKAATLNARVGDVMIPNVVHDEHSKNTYLFNNCFSAKDVVPYMAYGMVLDNQKAITARGTFLQNPSYMNVFYREGYTDIEMEAGPYLSAIYEAYRPTRHPQDEIVNLYGIPFDVGFLHYASDTPMGHGHNLGSGSLSYGGVDPTYATTIAILKRILQCEAARLQ